MTIAETGLPGRPNTSCCSRVPNHVGLPGFSAIPQKRSCGAQLARACRVTWSCAPTETPPQSTSTSLAPERAGDHLAGGAADRRRRPPARRQGARRSSPAPGSRGRWSCRSLRRAAPLARLEQLITGGDHRHQRPARAATGSPVPSEAATPSAAGPSVLPGAEHHGAGRGCPRRCGGCRRRRGPARAGGRARRGALHVLDRHHRVGPAGSIAPVEMDRRLQRPDRLAASGVRLATRPPARASRARPPGPRRGPPLRTAKPSIAELSNGGTGRRCAARRASTRPSASSSATDSSPRVQAHCQHQLAGTVYLEQRGGHPRQSVYPSVQG